MATKQFVFTGIGSHDNWPHADNVLDVYLTGDDKVNAINPGVPPNHDDADRQAARTAAAGYSGNNPAQDYKIDSNFPEKFASVSDFSVHFRGLETDNDTDIQVGVTLDNWTGVTWSSAINITSSYANYSASLARPGGGSWVEADFRNSDFRVGIRRQDTGASYTVHVTSIWPVATYVPSVTATIAPRETASRLLRLSRLPVGIIDMVCRLDAADMELLEDFVVTHFAGPHSGAAGWGRDEWERRLFRLLSVSIDPNTLKVNIRGRDLRNYACQFWDTAIAPYSVQSDSGEVDGPARLDRGVTRTYTRADYVYLQEQNGLVVQLGANTEPVGPSGTLVEESKKNFILNPGFHDWSGTPPNNWIAWGTGVTFGKETSTILYDVGVSAQALKVIRGSATGGVYQDFTPDAINEHLLSVDCANGNTDAYIWLEKDPGGTDDEYWNDATETWQVATASMTVSSTTYERFESNPIPLDTAYTYRLWIGCGAGASTNYSFFSHVQVEESWFASSRIFSTAAIGEPEVRQNPTFTISNDLGRRCWPAEAGTLLFRFKPNWSSADYPDSGTALNAGLFEVAHATDYFRVYYDIDNAAWEFVRYDGSTTATASYSAAVVADTEYAIACRWMSTGGELDLNNYTISIFVDGAKGTDATGSAAFDEDDDNDMTVGDYTAANGTRADGYISEIEIVPFVLSDTEIAARSA